MRRVTGRSRVGRGAAVAVSAALLLSGCSQLERISDALAAPSDAELLAAVSLTAADAADGATFQPYEGGTEVFGRTSLDLCFADFPSEDLRSGRNQVGIGDEAGISWVSSEAVLYPTPEDAEQAMGELERAREECPSEPVEPPQPDRDALAWEFLAAPDADWPQAPGITRQSYAFEATNPAGEAWTSTATYLQRGRMILALYTTPPDSPAATLRNAPDPARFVEVMGNRLASLPEGSLQYGEPLDDPNDLSV
ncbi:MAG: hypothetical protein MUF09_03110 [Candidatus Nanopelagicales bacterium]|nr:hypothetical protein [Candidatus Nanopelagicales bacterium]